MPSVQLISHNSSFRKKFKSALSIEMNVFTSGSLTEGLRNTSHMPIDFFILDATSSKIFEGKLLQRIMLKNQYITGGLCMLLISPYDNPKINKVLKFAESFEGIQDILWYSSTNWAETINQLKFSLRKNLQFLYNRRHLVLLRNENETLLKRKVKSWNYKTSPWKPKPTFLSGSSDLIKSFQDRISIASSFEGLLLFFGKPEDEILELANIIHSIRFKENRPFISVNFEMIPTHLHESTIFGIKNSEIGETRKGALELGQEGTVFLIHIEKLSWELQGKVLQLLQEKQFNRVNEKKRRLLTATIVISTVTDLDKTIHQSKFRQDLYYKIHTFSLRIPSLLERKKDLPEIIFEHSNWYSQKYQLKIKLDQVTIKMLSQLVTNQTSAYEFTEVLNTIFRQIYQGKEQNEIIRTIGVNATKADTGLLTQYNNQKNLFISEDEEISLAEVEKKYIANVLKKHRWNISEAARILKISRKTIYDKVRRYELQENTSS